MSENDFYVALQFIFEKVKDDGRSLDWIEENAKAALSEFLDEAS